MNKEYLLEKTGGDPEIEGLESLLAVYRFEPGRAPVLPAETTEMRRPWFGWLRFSVAAGAAAVAVFAGLLAYGRIEKLLLNADRPAISEVAPPGRTLPLLVEPSQPSDSERSIAAVDLGTVPSRRTNVQPIRYRKPAAIPSIEKRRPQVALSKREKYAYNQLMVALYITGTKLKVVQDTIDRVDDKTDERANNEK